MSLHICVLIAHFLDSILLTDFARKHFLDEMAKVLDSTKEIVKNNNVCGVTRAGLEIGGGLGGLVIFIVKKLQILYSRLLAGRRWWQ